MDYLIKTRSQKMKYLLILWFLFIFSNVVWAKGPTTTNLAKKVKSPISAEAVKEMLLTKYEKTYKTNKELVKLQKFTLMNRGKSVPALIHVMKSTKYPDKNRWIATFLLGKIMGKRSAPFISKFLSHPNWVMRLASLKTLLALGEKNYGGRFAEALQDKSYIVRTQALENIRKMRLKKYSANVWQMLYDKRNYYAPKGKTKKRANIIKEVVKTVGVLKFSKAKDPLLKMVQKKRYEDIFDEISTSLEKITGEEVPKGNKNVKRRFWSRVAINNKVI